jgi:putative phosphoribosyl transferase
MGLCCFQQSINELKGTHDTLRHQSNQASAWNGRRWGKLAQYALGRNLMSLTLFKDRVHAGKVLAEALMKYAGRDDVIVLGLPRGGVPVAYEVARKLGVPLDVLVVRKLVVPSYEEFAMGAIASGGVRVLNQDAIRSYSITKEAVSATLAVQTRELQRRELAYRGHSGVPEIKGKIVLLIDDGIATGASISAAVKALRQQDAKQIIIAVPVAAPDSCAMLRPMVDDLIAILTPDDFSAVGQWFLDFSQTTDDEVASLLDRARSVSHSC